MSEGTNERFQETEVKRLAILHHHGPFPKFSRSNLTTQDYQIIYELLDAHLLPQCVGLVFQYFRDNLVPMHWKDPPGYEPPGTLQHFAWVITHQDSTSP